MRTSIIMTIFRKEIREVLRDKRMVFLIILLPFFLYPVLFTIIGKVGASQQEKMSQESVQVLLNPEGEGTAVENLLRQMPGLDVVVRDFDRAILDTMRTVVGVEVAPDFRTQLEAGGSAAVTVYADESKDLPDMRADMIRGQLEQLNQQLLTERLAAADLNPTFAQPVRVQAEDLATREQKAGRFIGAFLPMMILLFIFIGCIYIAIDISAGEKERRTLQTLFTAPVTTSEIIAGKFLAVASVGIVSAAMNLLSLVVAMGIQIRMLGAGDEIGMTMGITVSPEGWVWMVVLVLLSTLFLGALSLAVVLLANSYKEAQSYVSPLMMLVLIPAILSQMPGMELNMQTAFVPMLNIALGIGAVFKGAIDLLPMLTVVGMALLYGLIALWLASLTFGNESVVTGEKVNFKDLFQRAK